MFSIKSINVIILALLASNAQAAPALSLGHVHHIHKRDTVTCSFPNEEGMVEITNSKIQSNGWAQDGECEAGSYCQYACKPGYLMGQWNPSVTTYSYPGSQEGGLYCNSNGELSKPISDKEYCIEGKGTAKASNKAGSNVAFCQTVLPGNEEMLIPTEVSNGGENDLAVPGTDYFAQTASHFYINAPGVTTEEGCTWGSSSNPYGNWAPYVAGFNMDDNGNTYAKIGWNPIYVESASPFSSEKPNFGIRLKCDDPSQCNGDTCEINPATYGYNEVSNDQQSKADGASWCMVTASGNTGVTVEIFDI